MPSKLIDNLTGSVTSDTIYFDGKVVSLVFEGTATSVKLQLSANKGVTWIDAQTFDASTGGKIENVVAGKGLRGRLVIQGATAFSAYTAHCT